MAANPIIIDHLFRHQYGKMVSILTRIFGLQHLEMIEDAVQDTFAQAVLKWRTKIPENPEAWLTQAAKNRAIDLLRKIKAADNRAAHFNNGPIVMAFNDLFLDHEIEDSQLRMIFTACHPALNPKDQIAFALKTIAGFSNTEVAAALLLNLDTVKKRLSRAKQIIKNQDIKFAIPDKNEVKKRLQRVHEVIYLIFNEGFHSTQSNNLVRRDLCGEALRLCKLILKKQYFRSGEGYALFALLCFHSARLQSKLGQQNTLIDLKNQNRKQWHFPLIELGNSAMHKAMEYDGISTYHYEAAIAVEHLSAPSFNQTNWEEIYRLYQHLHNLHQTAFTTLNMCIVLLQLGKTKQAWQKLNTIKIEDLKQRAYLYYGVKAEYFSIQKQIPNAILCLDEALNLVSNTAEKQYLLTKKANLEQQLNT